MNTTTSWIKFFTAANIPSAIAASYASTFTDNRIQENMLLDLNKEYLRDMGITCMGDIIAILRHAKIVHEETVRDRVLGNATTKVPAAFAYRLNKQQPEVKAYNTLNSTVKKAEVVLPKRSILKRDIVPITYQQDSQIPELKKRKISLNTVSSSVQEVTSSSNRSTIFDRLGQTEHKSVIKSLPLKNIVIANDKMKESTPNTVFARLGMKPNNIVKTVASSVTSTAKKIEAPLEYQGVLKNTVITKRIITIGNSSVENKINAPPTMRADEAPVSAKDKLRLMTNCEMKKSVKFSNNVQYKEIEPIESDSEDGVRTVKDLHSEIFPINRRIINAKFAIKGTDAGSGLNEGKGTVFSRLGL